MERRRRRHRRTIRRFATRLIAEYMTVVGVYIESARRVNMVVATKIDHESTDSLHGSAKDFR